MLLLGVAPAVATLSAPAVVLEGTYTSAQKEVAFCAAAHARRRHLRQVACEVLDLAHAFSSCSRNDVDDRCLFAATVATDAFCWMLYLSRFHNEDACMADDKAS